MHTLELGHRFTPQNKRIRQTSQNARASIVNGGSLILQGNRVKKFSTMG
jgi:hypothetical protein